MRSNLSCVAKVLVTQQRKLSLANITRQGSKTSRYRALQIAVFQAPRPEAMRDPHTPRCSSRAAASASSWIGFSE